MKKEKNHLAIAILTIILLVIILFIRYPSITGNIVKIEEFAKAQICSDSDNGLDFFTKGQVKAKRIIYDDFCIDSNFLTEYYCSKGRVKFQEQDCRDFIKVCFEGECVNSEGNFFILAEGTDLAFAYSFIVALNALGYQFDNSIIRDYNEFEGREISDNLLLAIYNGEVSVIIGQDLIEDDLELGSAVHRIGNTLNLRNTVVSDMEVNSNNLRAIFPIGTTWQITQITDDDRCSEYVIYHDIYPNIWAGRVVWLKTLPIVNCYGSLDQVFKYEKGIITQISNITNGGTSEPESWGRNAVWSNYFTRPSYSEIYLYNESTIKKITNNRNFNLSATGMKIWENKIVWVAHNGSNLNDLYFYDGNVINKLTTADNNLAPNIHNNFIAWERWSNGKSEIYFYNGERISRLTNNIAHQLSLSVCYRNK